MELMYHYCSPNTFQQIIERKCLWLSSTKNMNDFAESKWLSDAVSRVLEKNSNIYGREWCDKAWDCFLNHLLPRYITCMSEEGDMLSQWRAYAQDGEGVSIGFDADALGIESDIIAKFDVDPSNCLSLIKVSYKKKEEVDKYIENHAANLIESTEPPNGSAKLFSALCAALDLTVKNKAFSEEKEMRIIYTPVSWVNEESKGANSPISNVKFRTTGPYLVSYHELDFSKKNAIKEIVLGPKNKFSDYDLERFLHTNQLSNVRIIRSLATYR